MDWKDYRPIIAELKLQGWTVEPTTQGHMRATPPDPKLSIIHFSRSPDGHATRNILRDLRRNGFQWPPPSKNEQAGAERMAKDSTDQLQKELTKELNGKAPPRHVRGVGDGLMETKLSKHLTSLHADATPPAPRIEAPVLKTEDQLFNELKEARLMDALAGDSLKVARDRLAAAQRELEHAEHEKRLAAEDLLKKKAAFDAAYVPS